MPFDVVTSLAQYKDHLTQLVNLVGRVPVGKEGSQKLQHWLSYDNLVRSFFL